MTAGPSHEQPDTPPRTCPGWRADGTFDPDACYHWDDDTGELTHALETECRCTTDCGDPGEAGCCFCNHTDVYEPCPVVGYGCGMNARLFVWRGKLQTPSPSSAARCDCCTDEQWKAASTPTAETLEFMAGASS